MRIEGADNNTPIRATKDGALHVLAVERPEPFHVALLRPAYASAHIAPVTPAAAGNVFAHLANTGTSPIIVPEIRLSGAAAESVDVVIGRNSALTGGTSTELVSLGPESVAGLDIAFNTGTGITGVDSGGKTCIRLHVASAKAVDVWRAGLVLGPGMAVWLKAVAGAVALDGHLLVYVP